MEPRFAACSVAHAAFVLRAHRRTLPLPVYLRISPPPQGTLFALVGRAAESVINTLLVHVQRLNAQHPSPVLTRIALSTHAVRGDVACLYDTPIDTPPWEGLSDDLRAFLSDLLPTDVVYTPRPGQDTRPESWLVGSTSRTKEAILAEMSAAIRWLREGPPEVRSIQEPLPVDLHRSVCALHDASKLCWRLAELLMGSNQFDLMGCNAYACAANYGVLFEWTIDVLLSGARDLTPFRAQLRSLPAPRPMPRPAPAPPSRKRARDEAADMGEMWEMNQYAGVAYVLELLRETDASFQNVRDIARVFFTTVLLLFWKTRGEADVDCQLDYVYGDGSNVFYTQFRVREKHMWPAILSNMDGELLPSISDELCDAALRVYAMIPTEEEGFIEDWPEDTRLLMHRVIHSRWLGAEVRGVDADGVQGKV